MSQRGRCQSFLIAPAAEAHVTVRPRESNAGATEVNDAGKRRVLTQQAGSGVQHHRHEEPSLALGESESDDGLDAVPTSAAAPAN